MKNRAVTEFIFVLTTAVFAGMFALACGAGQGGQTAADTSEPMKDVGHPTDASSDVSVLPDSGQDAGTDSGVDAEGHGGHRS